MVHSTRVPSREEDHKLTISGADPAVTRQAQVARLIGHVLMDRDVSLDIVSISKAAGLTETRVRELMSSQEFEDMVAPVIRRKAASAIGRGIDAMTEIMEDGAGAAPKDRIAAFRALTGAMESMSKVDVGHARHDAGQQIASILDRVKGMREKKIAVEKPDEQQDPSDR